MRITQLPLFFKYLLIKKEFYDTMIKTLSDKAGSKMQHIHDAKRVFEIFEQICSIPHGSGDMERISEWCVQFAKSHGLISIKDSSCNVIIFKDGSTGRESEEPIILQGHLDMVCQKSEGSCHDFKKDGIDFYYEDGFVKARGTTLGADDGIGVAVILALLESTEFSHPPIEAVFTTDEETGMYGALALDTSVLSGKRMINIDSESLNEVTVSCAGGREVLINVPLSRKEVTGYPVTITLGGLKGGHSGGDIHKNRLNADVLLGQVLAHIRRKFDFNVVSISGGDKCNAIARSSKAQILAKTDGIKDEALSYLSSLKEEISSYEPDFSFSIESESAAQTSCVENDLSDKIIAFLSESPQGVFAMSEDIEGLVETSGNLGSVMCDDAEMSFLYLFRSNKESSLDKLVEKITLQASPLCAKISIEGAYPAWELVSDSKLQEAWKQAFSWSLGGNAVITATHGGLECGIFTSKISGLDCISVGPEMESIHTTEEKRSVRSTEDFFKVIVSLLNNT